MVVRLVTLLSTFVLFLGCRSKPEYLEIHRVLIDRIPLDGAITMLNRSQLHDLTDQAIQRYPLARKVKVSEPSKILRLRLEPVLWDTSREHLGDIILSGKWADDNDDVLYCRVLIEKERLSRFENAFQTAAHSCLLQLVASLKLQGDSNDILIKRLQLYLEGKVGSRQFTVDALDILGERKVTKAIPWIGSVLLNSKGIVADTALRALANIGHTAAIPFITTYAERKSPEVYLQAIAAARQVGGKKAAAWLFTLSTGHRDEDIRETAKEALEYVER